ncbi:MAG: SEL1-like repeat protein [Gammaproteobacteria bacterium]|nr:SEL1-like repeat protein [Gammaproteobacteria bacterium]
MKKAVAVLILGLIAPLLASAQDVASLEQMRQAAQKGSADAQLEMGILYEFGYNMPKNDVNALAWYQLAAEQGNPLAVKRRDTLKARMKPDEIEAAQKLSQELAAQKPQAVATPPAAEPTPVPAPTEPVPASPAPAPEAPLAGPPNADKPSSAP